MSGVILQDEKKSQKSYGTAVALCGIFGVLGVHHFYIGNWIHGIIDVGLFVSFIVLLAAESPFAYIFLIIDILHTIVVFYKLIVGSQRDGNGLKISWE
jgi:TM2 domain-containing membrane protein YozV